MNDFDPSGASYGGTDRSPASGLRRIKLRHVLFVCLMFFGIAPLLISSTYLIRQNRDLLVQQEKEYLVRSAEAVSLQVDSHLERLAAELSHRGGGLLGVPGPSDVLARLRQEWIHGYLEDFLAGSPSTLALSVLAPSAEGVRLGPSELGESAEMAISEAFDAALATGDTAYRLVSVEGSSEPQVVVAIPLPAGGSEPELVIASMSRLPLAESVFGSRPNAEVGLVLLDGDDEILWSSGMDDPVGQAVFDSGVLTEGLGSNPFHLTRPIEVEIDGEQQEAEITVSQVAQTGWRVVVLKSVPAAYHAVDRMIYRTLLSSVLLVLLASLLAAIVARWVGKPIQRLAETSHEIASGNFGRRVDESDLTFEMQDLAGDFNRMCGHVERHVEQLRAAAAKNRELFIGSIRAFAAAIDAKDPYTRGHSDRVARNSRTIARHLGMDPEFQQQVWLGALLHDVGKIGVDDRILKDRAELTAEEFEQVKQHTVIGAEILGRIPQLENVVPAVRWHHENWNGRGYPDGLKSEEIPLIARIVAVADTFDAVTTNRPYQEAFNLEAAVGVIKKLTGTRFDAKIVTAFLKAFDSGDVYLGERHRAPSTTEEVEASAAALFS